MFSRLKRMREDNIVKKVKPECIIAKKVKRECNLVKNVKKEGNIVKVIIRRRQNIFINVMR